MQHDDQARSRFIMRIFSLFLLIFTLGVLKLPAETPAGQPTHPYPGGEKAEIWVLAGQSNMQGVGPVPAGWTFGPDPRIMMFNLDNTWMPAGLPLHRYFEATAPAYRNHLQKTPEEWAPLSEKSRKGEIGYRYVGPGLFFAEHLRKHIDKPIGLIPCALGGTSIAQWDPALRVKGDESLYGAMLERIQMVGRIRGVLWYQGESEALEPTKAPTYERNLLRLVDSLRRDTGIEDLPFVYVQLAPFAAYDELRPQIDYTQGLDQAGCFDTVREAQRLAATKRRNVFVTSAIDLRLADLGHIDYKSQQRLGRRLAEVALNNIHGQNDHGAPIELNSVELFKLNPVASEQALRVRLNGVTGKLCSSGKPTGFSLRSLPGDASPPSIFRVELEGEGTEASCTIRINKPLLKPALLYYGAGLVPYVNITDELDMPIPAFGPIRIEPLESTLPWGEGESRGRVTN